MLTWTGQFPECTNFVRLFFEVATVWLNYYKVLDIEIFPKEIWKFQRIQNAVTSFMPNVA